MLPPNGLQWHQIHVQTRSTGGIMFKRRSLVIALLALLAVVTVGSPNTTTHAGGICYGTPSPRLTIGTSARVTAGLPNALRNMPNLYGSWSYVMAWIPGGGTFM